MITVTKVNLALHWLSYQLKPNKHSSNHVLERGDSKRHILNSVMYCPQSRYLCCRLDISAQSSRHTKLLSEGCWLTLPYLSYAFVFPEHLSDDASATALAFNSPRPKHSLMCLYWYLCLRHSGETHGAIRNPLSMSTVYGRDGPWCVQR